MYRVELKGFQNRDTLLARLNAVPNVPCGVESLFYVDLWLLENRS